MSSTQDVHAVQRHIAVSRTMDKSRASFLDLPAEMRNDVYRHCLGSDQRLAVKSQRPYYVDRIVLRSRPSLQPKLLRVCHQIKNEAITILYGENTFYVSSHRGVGEAFYKQIGTNIRYIRDTGTSAHVFEGYEWSTIMTCLRAAENLNSLRFTVTRLSRRFTYDQSVAMVAGDLAPLILHFHQQRKDTDREQALDLLEWKGIPLHPSERTPETQEKSDREAQRFGAQVRELLAKDLK